MRPVLCVLVFLLAAACRASEGPDRSAGPDLIFPYPLYGRSACPELYAGDYFYDAGPPAYRTYYRQVRVFWRGRPARPYLCNSYQCWPTRYVIVHAYGGCGARDEACMSEALERLRQAGVTAVEIQNEQGTECYSCLAAQRRAALRAKAMDLTVWANVEPTTPDGWDVILNEWLGLADRLALHALLPADVRRIPSWLWGTGKLEISTDGQHCQDLSCRHVDSTELLKAVVDRLKVEPAYVTVELDYYENGRVEADWAVREEQETHEYVMRGCMDG